MKDSPERRVCPGCQAVMQMLHVGTVEVDRCFFCGGFWFDRDELDAAVGRGLRLEITPRESARTCVFCQVQMQGAQVEGVAVETCTECGGVYLDDGELTALAGREVSLRMPGESEAGREDRVSFACIGCGRDFDLSEARTVALGLVCAGCLPGMDSIPTHLRPAMSPPTTRLGATWNPSREGSGFLSVLSGLVPFF